MHGREVRRSAAASVAEMSKSQRKKLKVERQREIDGIAKRTKSKGLMDRIHLEDEGKDTMMYRTYQQETRELIRMRMRLAERLRTPLVMGAAVQHKTSLVAIRAAVRQEEAGRDSAMAAVQDHLKEKREERRASRRTVTTSKGEVTGEVDDAPEVDSGGRAHSSAEGKDGAADGEVEPKKKKMGKARKNAERRAAQKAVRMAGKGAK